MLAILLISGKSKRFWPLQDKSLFPLCGTTLLELQIKRLKGAGFKEILVVAGTHNVKELKKLFPGISFVIQPDDKPGMDGALLSALPRCKENAVMIVSSNDLIDESAYKDLRTKGLKKADGGLLLAQKVKTYFPGGYLSLRGKRITGIVEKPEPGTEPSKLVNIVAHVHTDASVLLAALKSIKSEQDDRYERAIGALLNDYPYEAVEYTGVWQPVKYPWHLLSALEILLPKNSKPVIHKAAKIHPTAVVEGSVVIGANVKIFAHATVMGPCVIGDGTIIANNALVRGSSVGKNCVIGFGSEVARSVVADNVWTHMSYLGDSVVGIGVSLGGGTMTGNLRLDETDISSMVQGKIISTGRLKLGAVIGANCRTGIHTGIAPGVKVGAGSFINSMTMVTEDVPDGSFVKEGVGGGLDIRVNKTVTAVDRADFRTRLA